MIIEPELTDAFNSKPRININNIKTMTPSQLDSVKVYGSAAENLLKNKDFAVFIHHYKFEMCDRLTAIASHSDEDNAKRVAIANNISGIDEFIKTLQQAVYYKNQVVSRQSAPVE